MQYRNRTIQHYKSSARQQYNRRTKKYCNTAIVQYSNAAIEQYYNTALQQYSNNTVIAQRAFTGEGRGRVCLTPIVTPLYCILDCIVMYCTGLV